MASPETARAERAGYAAHDSGAQRSSAPDGLDRPAWLRGWDRAWEASFERQWTHAPESKTAVRGRLGGGSQL